MKKCLYILLVLAMVFSICCAFAEDAEIPNVAFETIGEAYALVGNTGYCDWGDEKIIVLIDLDGRYFRVVATMDETAKEKQKAMIESDGNLFDDYQQYIESLPVDYVEEITARPISQEDLDLLVGKTISELGADGYSMFAITWNGGDELFFTLANGFFCYDFGLNASFEDYEKADMEGTFGDLTVKSVKFAGLSNNGLNFGYHADGSYEAIEGAEDDYNDLMQIIFDAVEEAQGEGVMDPAVVIAKLTELMPGHAADFQELVPLFFDTAE